MSKFKVGDKVRILNGRNIDSYTGSWTSHMDDYVGQVFTITEVRENDYKNRIGYKVKEQIETFDERGLVLVTTKQSIHITVDGTTTVAVLKEGKNIVKREEAKLSPNDTFDFETGAEIAFNRLFGIKPFKHCDSDGECKKNEPNLYICIKDRKPGEWLTKGKTYSFVDGRFTFDDSYESAKYKSFEDFKKTNSFLASCLQPISHRQESEPQVKEVKRKAKVGEWVKIVNPLSDSEQYYQKDDICKCIKIKEDCNGCYVTTRGTHPYNCGNNTSYLYNREYVVLENYTPQQEQPKTYTQSELDEVIKTEREKIYAEFKKIFEK